MTVAVFAGYAVLVGVFDDWGADADLGHVDAVVLILEGGVGQSRRGFDRDRGGGCGWGFSEWNVVFFLRCHLGCRRLVISRGGFNAIDLILQVDQLLQRAPLGRSSPLVRNSGRIFSPTFIFPLQFASFDVLHVLFQLGGHELDVRHTRHRRHLRQLRVERDQIVRVHLQALVGVVDDLLAQALPAATHDGLR